MAQLFYVATFGQRNWIVDHISAAGAPVLNDKLGDLVHTNFEAAEKLGLDIASDVEVANKGMDIICLNVPDEVLDGLRRTGHIAVHDQPDAFGAELMRVTAHGAGIINGFCDFDSVRRFIPEALYRSLRSQNFSGALN